MKQIENLMITLVVGICYTVVMILVYCMMPEWHGELLFFATLTGSIPAATAAIYAAYTFYHNSQRDKQHKSFEFLRHMNTSELIALRIELENHAIWRNTSVANVIDAIENDPGTLTKVSHLLGSLEDASIAIRSGYFDECMIYKSMEQIISETYDRYRGYIEELGTRYPNRNYYLEFKRLAEAWRQGRSLADGREFPNEE